MKRLFIFLLCLGWASQALAHKDATIQHKLPKEGAFSVHFLGNAGVMIVGSKAKILFDPFFHNHYGRYSLVPEDIRNKIFANQPPYDAIDAMFVSHMHEDHFDVDDATKYLINNPKVKAFMPQQAKQEMQKKAEFDLLKDRIFALDLALAQEAKTLRIPGFIIEAVYIPHAGWPNRKDVQNIVFRVISENDFSVMHLGDAATQPELYEPHQSYWQARRSELALVPFWLASPNSQIIINEIINSEKNIGVHVPTAGIPGLEKSDLDYFLVPGETRTIK